MQRHFPFISIILPIKNAERTLDKSLSYLLKVNYPRQNMEIVLADGGSTDGTLEVVKQWQQTYPFIKLVQVPNCPSPGFARNKALETTHGEFIFFTDGDCAPCEDWVTEILRHFYQDPKIGAVGGEVYTLKVDPNNLTEIYCEAFRFNMVSPRYNFIQEGYFPDFTDMSPTEVAGHRAYFFGTCNVAYRKEALDKSNLRFWDYPTGEDMDFSHKLKKNGWRLYFAPKAKVDHMHRSDFKALKKVWATYGQAHPLLVRKHARNYFELVLQFLKSRPRIKIPSPIKGFLYIGNFHLMHLGLALFILSLILKSLLWAGVFLALTVYFAYQFFKYCHMIKPRRHILSWYKMKYLTNLSFLKGGLKGSLKYKVLCIEPSF
jgi:cellulose synthase/poly-beta-1,6-N-acetylglucosamine synthase-like glycosyltransferase